jgi:hypothetical protein
MQWEGRESCGAKSESNYEVTELQSLELSQALILLT